MKIPKINLKLKIFNTNSKICFAKQKFRSYSTDLNKPSAAISVFEMFSIGLGPSSSHTVGPMRAAKKFVESLENKNLLEKTKRVNADLYGSLALTGEGHGTPKAILLGLSGEAPATVDIDSIRFKLADIWQQKRIPILGKKMIRFEKSDLKFFMEKRLKYHSNGMEFAAFEDEEGKKEILRERYYSIGGGFFVSEEGYLSGDALAGKERKEPKFPFRSGSDLLKICEENKLSISDVARINETTWTPEDQIDSKLDQIWEVMNSSIERGMKTKGILPGGLSVVRRAPKLFDKIKQKPASSYPYDYVTIYAIAVNEENAAGGRVVTAPTNGASGIIPAVCKYYTQFVDNANQQGIRNYLLTSAIIGMLFKSGASISAAEVGCQGEVGVACSMAAGGLAEVLGGSVLQVENAAEIGMEHNLGLTCDPIGGLVQIPCIERNVMGAVKAITSARLALNEDSRNIVSLDEVIATMAQTGKEMSMKYKETAQGGLAVNVTEC